ncbi:hypothetical protein [Phaeobacter inhibens]|uniref:hypothetical protein n=1 Tax=Phaeobacter inhibens TaxID=221822 RepID=UPI0021A7F092|nr:hypothetical protein [Phaeobacter inhibens]UWS07063.1 hypothetical protein K4K98_12525 [Phaeobacter inhibens]
MINTGEDLVFLSKLSKRKLRQALASVRRDLKRASEINGSIHNRRRLSQFEKLSEVLSTHANPMRSVHEVYQMLMGENVPEEGVAHDVGYHRYSPNGGAALNLRSVSSALLFQLWCQRSIILPYRFNFQKTVSAQMRSASTSKVVKFVSEFEQNEGDAKRFGRLVSKRIKTHCWVWLFTTSWVNFEDITIEDYQTLSKVMAARQRSAEATNSPTSVNLFVSVSLARRPDEIRFSVKEFNEMNEASRAEAYRVGAHSRNKTATEQVLDSVVSYMNQTEKSVGFMKVNTLLEGTEFEIGEDDLRVWCELFSSYLEYRQVVQGYEDTKTVMGSLRKLADYISFFLPTKLKEGNLSADLVVRTPKCFRRSRHVVAISDDMSSITYREYLSNFSKSNDTLRALIGHAAKFFEWVEVHYSDVEHEEIAGPGFRNPFNLEFDQPISRKRYHTNKRNISRYALPHLLLWLHEIERFGMHLQKLEEIGKLEGVPKVASSNIEHHLSPANFGFEASYKISGETVIIDRIPLRLLRSGRTSGPIWLSHLRWQIFTLETGLRHQSTQWLDHRSWKQMSESESEKEVRNIHINTDKVHGPFVVPVLARVWNLLCRQNRQEESSGNAWQAVPYEGRKHSRFSDVEHLFRSYKGKYINDGDYWEFWRLLMFSFQCHASWLKLPLREVVKYSGGGTGGTKKDNVTRGDVCSLKLEYEHSPHSCRSTFVTNRVPFVDLGTLANQVGHSNELATQHYVYPDFDELSKRLEQSDVITIRKSGAAVTGGPAYV